MRLLRSSNSRIRNTHSHSGLSPYMLMCVYPSNSCMTVSYTHLILKRICQLSLTRITHQVSRAFDLNFIHNNILSCIKKMKMRTLYSYERKKEEVAMTQLNCSVTSCLYNQDVYKRQIYSFSNHTPLIFFPFFASFCKSSNCAISS